MHIISLGYSHSPGFNDPVKWLTRISFYTGILEELAKTYAVTSIEQIGYTGELQQAGVNYHFLDTGKSPYQSTTALNRHVKALKPDIVLVNGLIFPLQVMQLRWMIGNDPAIFLLHRAEKPAFGIRRSMQAFADRFIDGYFFISKEMAMPWIRSKIISRSEKIIEAMDASSVFQRVNKEEARERTEVTGQPVFLWVGRLEKNKDPVTVVKGFLEFAKHAPLSRLYMIYQDDGLLQDVQQLLATVPEVMEQVVLLGKKSREALQDWYNTADFIISGSHYEGSGIAIVEAMSCGCIPVLTDIPSFRKIRGEGECGLLYEAGDHEGLTKALLQAERMNRHTEREKAYKRFVEEFSPHAIAKKMEDAFLQRNTMRSFLVNKRKKRITEVS